MKNVLTYEEVKQLQSTNFNIPTPQTIYIDYIDYAGMPIYAKGYGIEDLINILPKYITHDMDNFINRDYPCELNIIYDVYSKFWYVSYSNNNQVWFDESCEIENDLLHSLLHAIITVNDWLKNN